MNLTEKIEHSLDLICRAEKLALAMQPKIGFHVGFSGGKDSQVMLELVKMAGVKYRAVYNVTTNDPAENVRFIRKYYPEVIFDVKPFSYFQMIEKKGVPGMFTRWCCDIFKETTGMGFVTLTGVRREESRKRAAYEEISKWSRNKEKRGKPDLKKMEENQFQCIKGHDKFMVYPILEWSENNVWEFIHKRGLPVNPCYSKYNRVGCVFCPFAPAKKIDDYCATHPKLKAAFIHAIERYIAKSEKGVRLDDAQMFFEWWKSHKSVEEFLAKKRQLEIPFGD